VFHARSLYHNSRVAQEACALVIQSEAKDQFGPFTGKRAELILRFALDDWMREFFFSLVTTGLRGGSCKEGATSGGGGAD
jgi:hypothetical protein